MSVEEEWTFLSSSLTSPSVFSCCSVSQCYSTRKSDHRPQAELSARVHTHVCGFNCVTLNALTGRGAFSATEFRCCVVCNVLVTFTKWLNVLH